MRSATPTTPRRSTQRDQQARAEQRQIRGWRRAPGRRVDRAGAEDQHRHVQRQDQQREHCRRRAARASAPRRSRPAATGSACRAGARPPAPAVVARIRDRTDAESDRQHRQRQAGRQPVRRYLAGHDQRQRLGDSASARACRRRSRPRTAAAATGATRAAPRPTARPARCARSRFGSGPTPSGTIVTTTTKKNSVLSTSAFCRAAQQQIAANDLTR